LVGPAGGPVAQAEAKYVQTAARTLGLRLLVFNVTPDTEITSVFATLVEHQVGAILMGVGPSVRAKQDQILSHAARFAIPTMFYNSFEARAGALLSYAPDVSEILRQVGAYTARILKGEKPADLPVVQPTKFEFVINLKTAGLETVPPSVQILARHLKLTRQGAHVLARQHPADDADLELPAEDTVGRFGLRFALGHTFSYARASPGQPSRTDAKPA
jgi:ABC-type uncharacterized transport system substrate-binding protein